MTGTRPGWLPRTVVAAVVIAVLGGGAVVGGADGPFSGRDQEVTARLFAIGVIGDLPYTPPQVQALPGFVDAMSADTTFRLVIHLGDIKDGGSACTDAYLAGIRDVFHRYAGALVYTPGDNEWTDCHRNTRDPRNPVERLGFLRATFYGTPGTTLGRAPRQVLTQGGGASFPAFVENQVWMEAKTVFAVVNLPGSNNDLTAWTLGVGTGAERQAEFDSRLAADLAWLDHVFALAAKHDARAVVLGCQADMWDRNAGAANLTGYRQIVQRLATLVRGFGKPVLFLNGDSHTFTVDNPLAQGDALHGVATPVPNLTRIVVHGGDSPLEYLRLSIDSRQDPVRFEWKRVVPPPTP